jgi:hypothetical protein
VAVGLAHGDELAEGLDLLGELFAVADDGSSVLMQVGESGFLRPACARMSRSTP